MLAGLKHRLMAPEAAVEAIQAYAEETNRLNRERRASGARDRKELAAIEKKIATMIAVSTAAGLCATRVAVLYLGQLMELQETEAFFRSEGHPYSQALLKSTPRLRVGAGDSALHTIKGEIPSPIDVPPGCPFLSRCPEGDHDCERSRPSLQTDAGGGLVACFKRDAADLAAMDGAETGSHG